MAYDAEVEAPGTGAGPAGAAGRLRSAASPLRNQMATYARVAAGSRAGVACDTEAGVREGRGRPVKVARAPSVEVAAAAAVARGDPVAVAAARSQWPWPWPWP